MTDDLPYTNEELQEMGRAFREALSDEHAEYFARKMKEANDKLLMEQKKDNVIH